MSTIFKVAYMPNIKLTTADYIKRNVTASMESNDGNSKQYHIDAVKEALSEGFESDLKIIEELNVDYIEI